MQFKSDKPFPETETGAESGTPVIDLYMTGGVDFDSEASRVIDGHVEGQFLDDNTMHAFSVMILLRRQKTIRNIMRNTMK